MNATAPKKKPSSAPPPTVSTTVKLPENMKLRVAVAAEMAGKTPHAFMVDAIEDAANRSDLRRAFVAEAREAEERILRTGKAIPHAAVVAHFKARAAGENPPPPKPVKWRK
jgi:predicted transcriptional regulator